ncbi:MAG: chemotaxis protein CheZ [Lysobacterales bacterium 13-68-4]|jgi:chemotaxis protein CheZ|nr:MAG: chemotaxis protein CheZ [Xanthomonadales bacterium 15-68-25]OZB67927.1 MAG: chemotaxis protein CheZ [Xanthomonadales bacterium 14-68-21]OZB73090.1 MAG: chemotaxis protein CheZ [Xanthomonadales bacterium 13-68-4]
MSAQLSLTRESLPDELHQLLTSPDGPAFEHALDSLVRQREQKLFRALGVLARDLHDAVSRLGGDLVQEGYPDNVTDARKHLQDVLEMSSQAAHRTIDFAERMRPQAAALASDAQAMLASADGSAEPVVALATQANAFAEHCTAGLNDMVMAQSWQDLSGQRIKKVVSFIGSVESAMIELVRLTGALSGRETVEEVEKINSQDEADRLLSEFGF